MRCIGDLVQGTLQPHSAYRTSSIRVRQVRPTSSVRVLYEYDRYVLLAENLVLQDCDNYRDPALGGTEHGIRIPASGAK